MHHVTRWCWVTAYFYPLKPIYFCKPLAGVCNRCSLLSVRDILATVYLPVQLPTILKQPTSLTPKFRWLHNFTSNYEWKQSEWFMMFWLTDYEMGLNVVVGLFICFIFIFFQCFLPTCTCTHINSRDLQYAQDIQAANCFKAAYCAHK